MIRIGIAGCAGRMGQMLVGEVLNGQGVTLAGGTESPGSAAIGRDLGELLGGSPIGMTVGDNAGKLFDSADAVIDFTSPAATAVHAQLAQATGTAYVIGTTGLSAVEEEALRRASARAAIVWTANMSVGVTLLLSLVEQAAKALDSRLADIEIVEMHHRHKVDAPSGTALALGRAAAAGRGVALEDVWEKVRDGHTGARPVGNIGFATLRGGDVVGDHTVVFAAEGERIEITHRAGSRQIFAKGALRAALWACSQPAGLYAMKDVLGLNGNPV